MTRTKAFRVAGAISILLVLSVLLIALFAPGLPYHVMEPPQDDIASEDFFRALSAISDGRQSRRTHIEIYPNGENFYEAELAAIRQAQRSVNLEAYIFSTGEVTRRFLEALTERARAGVKVNVVIDYVGSMKTTRDYVKGLTDAGGDVRYYHPIRWYNWPSMNNRTHRELLVVDGRVAFVGGAGFADHWLFAKDGAPRWRDSMFRVEGDAVASLQGTFLENWVEASGLLLTGPDYFQFYEYEQGTPALVVNSTPSSGSSTRARMLFQTLIASARKELLITTPYFLPDAGIRQELIRAIRDRGVQVRILLPGPKIDHSMTRSSSRAMYGELLEAGAKVYEYQPGMLHAKALMVDDTWVVVGSTNMDNRSFGLNDEINLAAQDAQLAARMEAIFESDLQQSREVTLEQWKKRPLLERVQGRLGLLLERQQ